MTSVSLATNDAGQAVAQPAHSQYPMVAEDVTDADEQAPETDEKDED